MSVGAMSIGAMSVGAMSVMSCPLPSTRLIQVQGQPLGQGALPALITPLIGQTQADLLAEVAIIVPKAPDLLEWRVDFYHDIGDAAAVIDTALAIRRAAAGIPVLLTCRSVAEGGQPLSLSASQVVALYAAACQARCIELMDYELANEVAHLRMLREVSQAHHIGLIASYHNFQATPDAAVLDEKFAAAQHSGADVAKVAVMPSGPQDVLALLAATDRARQTLALPLISMALGGIGSLSRLMGWVYGSAATFAIGRYSSAPGQISIEDLRAALAILRPAVLGRNDKSDPLLQRGIPVPAD